MEYSELMEKAIKGRSVLSLSKLWGVPQPTLRKWLIGQHVPGADIIERIIAESEVEALEAVKTIARQERMLKAAKFKLQSGFAQTEALAIGAAGSIVAMLSILCKMPERRKYRR